MQFLTLLSLALLPLLALSSTIDVNGHHVLEVVAPTSDLNPVTYALHKASICNQIPVGLPKGSYFSCEDQAENGSRTCELLCKGNSYPSKFTCDPATGWPALSCPLPFHENYACGTTTWTFFSADSAMTRQVGIWGTIFNLKCYLYHCGFLSTSSRRLFVFGRNENGELGDLTKGPGLFNMEGTALATESIHDFVLLNRATLVLTSSYELYGFGMNTYNQLFQAAAGGDVTTPTKSPYVFDPPLNGNTKMACAEAAAIIITDGVHVASGYNSYAQLSSPASGAIGPVTLPIAHNATTYLSGFHSWGYIADTGDAWARGYSDYGNLGAIGSALDWTKIAFPTPVTAVALGFRGTIGLGTNGRVFVLGSAELTGEASPTATPIEITTEIKTVTGGEPIKNVVRSRQSVMAYSDHTLVSLISETTASSACSENTQGVKLVHRLPLGSVIDEVASHNTFTFSSVMAE